MNEIYALMPAVFIVVVLFRLFDGLIDLAVLAWRRSREPKPLSQDEIDSLSGFDEEPQADPIARALKRRGITDPHAYLDEIAVGDGGSKI